MGQRIFESVFLVLVGILGVTTFLNFIQVDTSFGSLVIGLLPHFPRNWEFTAVVGSIIMPQNIILHSSLVQTWKYLGYSKDYFVKIFKIETMVILVVSFLINFSFVGIFAHPVFKGVELTLENAGEFMSNFLPKMSYFLWSVGLLSSGISSTTAGALTG